MIEREATTWVAAAERLPDDDMTVLIALDDGEVWTGYRDGDDWRDVEVRYRRQALPTGPICRNIQCHDKGDVAVSTIAETILSAVDDGARNTAAIAEATGLEKVQVQNNVSWLKSQGKLVKTDDGLARGDSAVPAVKAKVHAAPEPREPDAPTPKKRAKAVAKPAKRTTAPPSKQHARSRSTAPRSANASSRSPSRARSCSRLPRVRVLASLARSITWTPWRFFA